MVMPLVDVYTRELNVYNVDRDSKECSTRNGYNFSLGKIVYTLA